MSSNYLCNLNVENTVKRNSITMSLSPCTEFSSICPDQVGYSPGMQVGLMFKNIITMMHDKSRLKEENCKVISVVTEKGFDKIQ